MHIFNIGFFRWDINEEERDRLIELGQRAMHAQNMMFDNNSGYWDFDIVSMVLLDPRFDSIVFVNTWQEGLEANFPNNVVVAWPTPRTIGVLESMNNRAMALGITFENNRLSYPITMEDVVYNWEDVSYMWINYLGRGSHGHAFTYFEEVQQEYFDEIADARRERGIPEHVRWRP
jgi:hypothetical protein